MELKLVRNTFTDESTIGDLYIGEKWECYTLEDKVRPKKIKGETAIPAGRYKVVITYSNRFKRNLPLLLNVPGFEGVRFHAGNTKKDTHGCPLVGRTKSKDFIGESRAAFAQLYKKIEAALNRKEEVWVTISEERPTQ
jgi:hypothetical protein